MDMRTLINLVEGKFDPKYELDIRSYYSDYHEKIKKGAALIKANCQLWLKQTDNGRVMFYRGSNKTDSRFFYADTRKTRRSLDLDPKYTKAINQLIKEKGLIANRKNSTFCTGDDSLATDYGNLFVYIPKGEFNYTWCDRLVDAYTKLENDGYSGEFTTPRGRVMYDKFKEIYFNSFHGDDNSLFAAAHSECEIMIASIGGYYIEPKVYNEMLKYF